MQEKYLSSFFNLRKYSSCKQYIGIIVYLDIWINNILYLKDDSRIKNVFDPLVLCGDNFQSIY